MLTFHVYIALVSLLTIVWFIYMTYRNPGVVDMFWPIGLLLAGTLYIAQVPFTISTGISASLLTIWALRLSGYIWYTRVRHFHIDKRYVAISKDWASVSFGFFLNYQLQAILIWCVAMPFYFIADRSMIALSSLDYFAIALSLIGIAGEMTADIQLSQFKKAHPKQVCNQGLWQYSRHPNYFFDWLTWLGFALFAIPAEYGYIALVSPILMYVIFNYVTGPITERSSIQSRGQAYLEYQQQTGMFFPQPKKK